MFHASLSRIALVGCILYLLFYTAHLHALLRIDLNTAFSLISSFIDLLLSFLLIAVTWRTLIVYAFIYNLLDYWRYFTFRKGHGALPPGPLTVPGLGFSWVNPREPQITFLGYEKEYGPIFTIGLPRPTVVVCGWEALCEVARLREAAARPSDFLYSIFMKERPDGLGIILSSGETWRRSRKFVNRVLRELGINDCTSERRIEYHGSEMIRVIEAQLDTHGEVLNLHKPLEFAVSNVINEYVIGKTYAYTDPAMFRLKGLLDDVLKLVQSPEMLLTDFEPCLQGWLNPYERAYRKAGQLIEDHFEREIARIRLQRQAATPLVDHRIHHQNLISRFLDLPGALVNWFFDLKITAGDLWTGGMETTLSAMRWAVIYLMDNPEVQERLHAEIINRYPRHHSGEFDFAGRAELPYLLAFTDETLRCANILPWNIPHHSHTSFTVAGHTIPAGTNLMLQYAAIHHNETYFPAPFKFDPERQVSFLRREPTPEEAKEWKGDIAEFIAYQPSIYLNPFGMGHRRCVGEKLARKELFVLLIQLLQRYKFSTVETNPPNKKRSIGMTSSPSEYVTRVERREDWYGQ